MGWITSRAARDAAVLQAARAAEAAEQAAAQQRVLAVARALTVDVRPARPPR